MKRTNEKLANQELKRVKSTYKILQGMSIHVLPARFGPHRLKLFCTNIEKYGGKCHSNLKHEPETVSYVVTEETLNKDALLKIHNIKDLKNAKFIKCTWLSKCFKYNTLLPINDDDLLYENPKEEVKSSESNLFNTAGPAICDTNSSQFDSLDDINSTKTDLKLKQCDKEILKQGHFNTEETCNKFIQKFACAHSSNAAPVNLNEHITDELEKLSAAYESRKDIWRAVGYQRAVAAIKNYPKRIETWEEAKSIRGVGERLADKIKEILDSGQLRKVKEVCNNEETRVLQLFIGVWGAGPTTANSWYTQGFRTLDDLRTKATLTRHQQIGLNYYNELNERMFRKEVEEIECQVRSAAEFVKKGLEIIVCGSFRRGKQTCGDVDILITHSDGVSHQNIFKPILEKLKENGFLTDDLVIQENNGNQQKYLGVCKLPGEERKHRRLDIIVVPYSELAPALMYFTGSAHFNRSMRLLATKLGMSLSEHGLRTGIVRDKREAVTGGRLLDTPTEESIFHFLNLPYRPPNERDH